MQIHDPDENEKRALELVRRVGKAFWDKMEGEDFEEWEDIEKEIGMTGSEASAILSKRLRPH